MTATQEEGSPKVQQPTRRHALTAELRRALKIPLVPATNLGGSSNWSHESNESFLMQRKCARDELIHDITGAREVLCGRPLVQGGS
jgi:hypothetical protein